MAYKNDWIGKDPFVKYSIPLREVKRESLTAEELKTLEKKEIFIDRLAMVRDAFVFSCYTGLAYSDISSLTHDHIIKGIDGEYWIKTFRVKMDTKTNIPLMPKALEIIAKYRDHPLSISKNRVIRY